MTGRDLAWRPDLKVPKTTFMLPVASDRPLDELGREAALKVLGSAAPEEQLRMFAQFIHDGTTDSRRRGAKMAGLIFFPDFTRFPPVANLDLFGFYPDDPGKPSSLETYRRIYGPPGKQATGPVEVTDVELPAGPALRFHRRWVPRAGLRGYSYEREDITYAIRPPQINDAVVLVVSWVEPAFSEALIKTADAVAKTLQVKPVDDF
jgi:hypothetical protein